MLNWWGWGTFWHGQGDNSTLECTGFNSAKPFESTFKKCVCVIDTAAEVAFFIQSKLSIRHFVYTKHF